MVLNAANSALDDIFNFLIPDLKTNSKQQIPKQKRTVVLKNCNHFKLLHLFVSLGAFVLFAIQARSLFAHYNEQVYFRTMTTFSSEFLQWPELTLQIDMNRNESSTKAAYLPEVKKMHYSGSIPKWAVTKHKARNQNYVTLNEVNFQSTVSSNMTLEELRSQWPLKTHFRNNQLHAWFNFSTENFIMHPDRDHNVDTISTIISSFESDSSSSSALEIQSFVLMPCEELHLYIALQHRTLKSQANSPCREDYPAIIQQMLPEHMDASLFYNSINAPYLPYDQETCVTLCETKYWLHLCGCYGSIESWRYAGKPANTTVCPRVANNCTTSIISRAPPAEVSKCECYPKCTSYKFHLIAADKIKYSLGNRLPMNAKLIRNTIFA